MRLILGSASPRRLDLLRTIGVEPAAVRPADIDETPQPGELPRPYCRRMAREKAMALDPEPGEAVLTADTTVAVGRRILGKPACEAEARGFLALLSGRRHKVFTAVALRTPERMWERDSVTTLKVKRLERAEIDAYLATGDWRGKARRRLRHPGAGRGVHTLAPGLLHRRRGPAAGGDRGPPARRRGPAMRGRTVALGHLRGAEAAALIEDGRLEDLLVAGPGALVPGAIYRGVVDRPLKGQGGAILRLPEGTAFLRQAKGRSPGEALLVQVVAHAEPGKAAPVTDRPLFKSRHVIVTPDAPGLNASRRLKDDAERDRLLEIAHDAMQGSRMGLILRSAAEGSEADALAHEIRAARELAERVTADAGREPELLAEGDGPHALAWREWSGPAEVDREPGALERHGVLDALDALASSRVPLGEASMFVEPTRALVAVDVNTGGDASPAAGLKADLAAARELPRQLRLRGLGGQVTVDLAPLPKRDRRAFEGALRAAFRADPVETTLVGWTPLGHYELQRRRERVPLAEVLAALPSPLETAP